MGKRVERASGAIQAAAVFCAAFIALMLSCAMSITAYAADVTVWGAQTVLDGKDAREVQSLRLVNMAGTAGDTVYVTAKDGSTVYAQYLPHELGVGAKAGADTADYFAIDLANGLDEKKLSDGTITVEVTTGRGGDTLYSGTVYGVWALLADADGEYGTIDSGRKLLIGAYVESAPDGFFFDAPAAIRDGDSLYRLDASRGPAVLDDGRACYYYKPVDAADEADAVDGVITYVDEDGVVLTTETIPAIPANGEVRQSIPPVISTGVDRYRTLTFSDEIVAKNPGRTSFTIHCAYLGGADYYALIQMVAGNEVLAQDSVSVDTKYAYTPPTYIYREEEVDGELRAVTYKLAGDAVYNLDADKDMAEVVNGNRTVKIPYTRQPLEKGTVEITYNQVSGTGESRLLGTQTVIVSKDNPEAVPAQTIEVDGNTWELQGDPSEYAYRYDSDEAYITFPVIDAYYAPTGFDGSHSYTVTVNYVDYRTGQVIRSVEFESTPDAARQGIDAPASISDNGTSFELLSGQEGLSHNHYSGTDTYTVYYRDANDDDDDATVTRTRVVVDEQNVTRAAAANADAGDGGAGARVGLNQVGTYNAIGGAGNNNTLVNNRGQDGNAERIGDDQTPLAQDATPKAPSDEGGIAAGAIAAGVVFVIAAIAALLWWFLAGRRRNEENEA